jgi:hypothetical protein
VLRQAGEFGIQEFPDFAPGEVVGGGAAGSNVLMLAAPPAFLGPASLPRGALGHGMEPAGQGAGAAQAGGPADQEQERGLEGVLGGVGIAQDVAADAKHQATMAPEQFRERRLVAVHRIAPEQFGVRSGPGVQLMQHSLQDGGVHGLRSPKGREASANILAAAGACDMPGNSTTVFVMGWGEKGVQRGTSKGMSM